MAKSCSCNDFNRAQLLRRGAAVAGRGLPTIEPGMPLPAGTGLDRRTFLLASAGAALSVYGASMLSPRQFEEGIAQASAAAPKQPVLVSIFMEGGWDALSVLAPIGRRPNTHEAASRMLGAEAEGGGGQLFTEDERSDVASAGRPAWPSSTRRARSASSPPSAMTRRTRATSPAATTGRSASSTPRHARAGWGASWTSTGEPGNPLQGLSLDYSLAPALATTKMPVAAVSSPADYNMWAYGLGEPIIDPALRHIRRTGCPRSPIARLRAGPRRVAGHEHRAQPDGARSSKRKANQRIKPTRPLPHAGGEFPERLAALAAMLACRNADQMRFADRRRRIRHALRRDEHLEHEPRRRRSNRCSRSSATSNSAGLPTGC